MTFRGRTWWVYTDDRGQPWAMLVDRDQFDQFQLGWQTEAQGELPPFPRGWLPRVAIGIDASGREHRVRIANVGADLWTGTTTAWSIETSGGGLQEAHLVRTLGERSVLPVASPEVP